MSAPRYRIGIDLGTTNCVLSYVDAAAPGKGARVLPVPQWDAPGTALRLETLPSFAYLTTPAQRREGFADPEAAPAPSEGWVSGQAARNHMAGNPGRVVHSAKSWLSHGQVDRTAPILPWQSEEVAPDERLSPVDASALYLRHLREAWDRSAAADDPGARFDAQEVVLTVPASFDEAAQELTLAAARAAGFPEGAHLLEEPQAAFYDWLGRGRNVSRLLDLLEGVPDRVARVLVCDVGGGTTDLSLFEVSGDPESPTGLALRRVAVSEHLLLGGDNIDMTLAHLLEGRLAGGGQKLTGRQWSQLLVQARDLKERILQGEEDAPGEYTVTLAGTGAGLLGSTRSATVTAEEVRRTVLDGFFPECAADDRPRRKTGGLREWGLPYAADTGVTRHLAAFLEGRRVDAVLYNGGTVIPAFLRERLTGLLTRWQGGEAPQVLTNDAMSLAVARGAARYAHLLAAPEAGQRIAGGHAHALYLEVVRGKRKKTRSLVCVLPRGMEPNETVTVENAEFDLLVNQPVRFQCHSSNRRHDAPGDVVPWREEEFHPLPPLQTAIHLPPERPRPANNRLRVALESSLNELGLLQLYCVEQGGEGRWRLDFNLRRAAVEDEEPAQVPDEPLVDARQLETAKRYLRALYGKKPEPEVPSFKPAQLVRRLEGVLGGKRDTWDSATLRALWPTLADGMTRRVRSVGHEEAWLYLAGYSLRPGYGFELDASRMEELWRVFRMGMAHPKEKRVQVQWYLLWRRTAGGLNAERQEKVLDLVASQVRNHSQETAEIYYLAGSLERARPDRKAELVRSLASGLRKRRVRNKEPFAWALGRLLARVPLYAGPEAVLPPKQVEKLFRQVEELDWNEPDYAPLVSLFAQAARRTDRRDADVSPELRDEILEKMEGAGAREEDLKVVREVVPVEYEDRVRQFGESLPAGLILVGEGSR